MDKTQPLSLLERAREEQDIYIIARVALMIRGRGHMASLTPAEHSVILQSLENARIRKGILGLEAGYELARWLLICRYLFPEREIQPATEDVAMIQEACDSYIDNRILKQVASLVHMRKELGIQISINRLPPKKRRYVLKLAATLA